jgi:hypothetical protein
MVQHDEPIEVHDGAQAMRDGNHRFAGHRFVHGGLNDLLALTVERAGGLIQQQNRRILEYRPRDRDALPLSAR